jgi:origin recognition complex subunit 2
LKKKASIKRVSKKLSIVPNSETNQEILAASLGLTGNVFKKIESETIPQVAKLKPEYTEISNHFVFGNQVAEGLVNKTSNNKLDQSLRISYADMVETLKSYEPPFNEAIDAMNKSFENDYFNQWLGLMKFGFNVLLDGVGSKKSLMQKFCQCHLADSYYVELLGYHHDFNTKNVRISLISIINLSKIYIFSKLSF